MSKYHQQYSELENIPVDEVLFLIRLSEAEAQYQEAEMKKMKANKKNRFKK